MDQIFEKIKTSTHLPQLPHVMLKLIRACGNAGTDMDELTQIISTDPALSAKLLQILASPYVNLPSQVNTIKAAVVYLGLDTIRNIAISSSAMHFFKLSRGGPDFDITRFWHHSYRCGVLARRLAAEENHANPEEFFLAGLLHDIGQLVLMRTFPKAYGVVDEEVKRGIPRPQAEVRQFEVDSSQVSGWLFNQWNLNPISSDAVLFINASLEQILGELSHVKILFLANQLAGEDAMSRLDRFQGVTQISEIGLGQIVAEAEDEVKKTAAHLGVSLGKDKNLAAEQAMAVDIKDFSLFYGTLDALLAARSVPDVLEAVQKGFEIIFNVPRVFFFLLDSKKNMMAGACNARDRNAGIVRSIALPLDNKDSLVVAAANTLKIHTSFDSPSQAVSDAQIIRLLDARGVYCIPIHSKESCLGVMALGVDASLAAILDRNQGLLTLFSRQTGICLENLQFHQTHADEINAKKMEAYTLLTDKVVHEVNNPIVIIKGYLDSLSLKLPDKHPAQEDLTLVGEEIYRISTLLEGLGRFSNPGVGGLDIIDINTLCKRVLGMMNKSILLPRQIQANIQVDEKIPPMKMDGNSLKQVLINLVKNSAEAMEKTGGKILVSTSLVPGSARVMIDEKKKLPGSVKIRIQDNGPGMGQEIRDHIFEPYNSSKGGKNAGLGLAIVHSIVKEMKGKITCDSEPGKGTAFTILLPMTGQYASGAGKNVA